MNINHQSQPKYKKENSKWHPSRDQSHRNSEAEKKPNLRQEDGGAVRDRNSSPGKVLRKKDWLIK